MSLTEAELAAFKAREIAGNVASIEKVPARLMTEERRKNLIAEAEAGMDIYCYSTIGHWNLWRQGQRIELGEFQEGDEV